MPPALRDTACVNRVTRVNRLGLVNSYLVTEDDGLTLIDTMIPRSSKAILTAAGELGAPTRSRRSGASRPPRG